MWRNTTSLLDGVAGIDSTVFCYGGRWWLFAGIKDDGPNYKLHAWYADSLQGHWEPHAANPIKIDVRNARGAGTPFIHEGVLYRPAQDCAGGYGRAVVINRVDELTPTSFRERAVSTISPSPGSPYPLGIHTLSAFGDKTLIDGKYRRVTGRGLRYQLSRPARKVAKLVRRLIKARR
jgi:hypothetical protein